MKTTNRQRLQGGLWVIGGALAIALLVGTTAIAQTENAENTLQVSVGESITMPVENVAKIAVAEPTIADVVSLSEKEISVIGKKVGNTTLTVVHSDTKPTQIYRIVVGNDSAVNVIRKVVGSKDINVSVVGDTIVLDGKVADEIEAQRAAAIAAAYNKDKVVNLLEIQKPRQIKIRTRIAEVNVDAVKHLGVKWFGAAGEVQYSATYISPGALFGNSFGSSYVSGMTQPQANGGSVNQTPGTIYDAVDVTMQLLQSKGYARLLSEPTLITYNGKEASFLVGQQWPIVQQLPQSFTVEFKDIGVRMKIKPTADSMNQINTVIHAEVSQVVGTTSAFNVPIIGTKMSDTTLQVPDGQTIIIAGLLDNNINRDTLRKLPWLAEIPVLGVLFRNKEHEQQQREVLFFVTPSVVKDVNAEVANASTTPVMKDWINKSATQNVLESPDKKDDWGMHNFDHMGFPQSEPTPAKPAATKPAAAKQPSPAKQPTPAKPATSTSAKPATSTPQSSQDPTTNYTSARPAGQ
jgi:pilus assembly protein CpaC